MNTLEKLHPGNTTFVNVVIIGLPLHVLGVNTAGVVIGKKTLERNELLGNRILLTEKQRIACDMKITTN